MSDAIDSDWLSPWMRRLMSTRTIEARENDQKEHSPWPIGACGVAGCDCFRLDVVLGSDDILPETVHHLTCQATCESWAMIRFEPENLVRPTRKRPSRFPVFQPLGDGRTMYCGFVNTADAVFED